MDSDPPRERQRFGIERQIAFVQLAAGGAAALLAGAAMLAAGAPAPAALAVAACLAALSFLAALVVRARVTHPLRTAASVLGALRAGDASIRARGAGAGDAVGEVLLEANLLAEVLRAERAGAREASGLLQTVMSEIDAGVFAFDEDDALRLVNRAGARLLGEPAAALVGRRAAGLGLDDLLTGPTARVVDRAFAGGAGRWGVRRSPFRERGMPHRLLVVTNLGPALRDEERTAWQRLIRVLGHELNNSLTPIKSIAGSLRARLARPEGAAASREEVDAGLAIVEERAAGLARFLEGYTRLARLPAPVFAPLAVEGWVRSAAALEPRVSVVVEPGPEVTIRADADQLQQLLINLLRNAADATLESGAGATVRVGWSDGRGALEVEVVDDGPGLADPGNLFVPFFTTKPHGTGIGLALARQIAEAHGGSLTLDNRAGARGCVARLRLPL